MGFYQRLLNFVRRDRLTRNLERELAFHIAEKTDDLIAAGMSAEEAQLAAKRQLGNSVIYRERMRDVDMYGWIESIGQDIRYGSRMIRRSPVFALVVVLSLAIGIGVNATLFSLTDAFLLRTLPLDHVRDLVYFQWASRSTWFALSSIGTESRDPKTGETTSTSFPYPMVQRLRESTQTL